MAEDGARIKTIAGCLGRTEKAVTHQISALGVRRKKPWSPTDDAELARLRREKMLTKVIASKLGRTPGSVRWRLWHIGEC